MGWFSSKVPDTIGKERGEKLANRARIEEARRGGMLSREAIGRRKKDAEQRKRSRWS
jgi:hypothetical protein